MSSCLIKFVVTLVSLCNLEADVFTTHPIGLATLTALNEQLSSLHAVPDSVHYKTRSLFDSHTSSQRGSDNLPAECVQAKARDKIFAQF